MNVFRYFNLFRLSRRINRWLQLRQWRAFRYGLPALLAFLLLVIALGMVLAIHRQSAVLHQRYHQLAMESLWKKNYEVARVACLRGLAGTGPENLRDRLEWTYFLALSLDGLGRRADAEALVNIAAPLDHPGCVPAHLGVAQGLLISTNLNTNFLFMAERHLKNALILEPQSVDANELLGRYYINTRQMAKARERLFKIYSLKPQTAQLLAFTYLLENDSAGGLPWADRAISAYEQVLVESAPKFSEADRLGLVRSLMLKERFAPSHHEKRVGPKPADLESNTPPQNSPAFWLGLTHLLLVEGKYAAALETLDKEMAYSTNSVYPAAIAAVCAVWAGNINLQQKNASTFRLQLIQKGLKNAPENIKLQMLLIQSSHASDSSGPAAKVLLDEFVHAATGERSAGWHFLLWTDARIRGNLAEGRAHLKIAAELAPQAPLIQNDVAMDLSSGSRSDCEKALKLLQPFVDKNPGAINLRDTRGQILARLGRNEEAAVDLEFVLQYAPNAIETRQTLEKIYAALGKALPSPAENVSATLGQVRSLVNQGNFAQAVAVLEKKQLAGSASLYAATLAEVYAQWLEKIPANSTNAARRQQMIEQGLRQNPEHSKLRARLIQAALASDASGLAAQNFLDQMVAQATGNAATEWHLALGHDARMKGDLVTARRHLQLAYEQAPQLTQVCSELSLVLAAGDTQDLPQALDLIKQVLEKFPNNPDFRNTRGMVLFRLGQYSAAVPDLEFAAAKLAHPVETRQILAQAYDALGKPQLAARQRQLAKP
ncbi:MAG: tetratricopeptide repeat protein [Verrucomicrobiota bacterium]